MIRQVKHVLAAAFLFIAIFPLYSQAKYTFNNENDTSSIFAYWYNCKPDSVRIEALNLTEYFHSTLQVYGPVVADLFEVQVDVFLPGNVLAYTNSFTVPQKSASKDPDSEGPNYSVGIIDDSFRIMATVDQLKANPEMIKVSIHASGKSLEKTIWPVYHKIYGYMTDFQNKPLKSYILVQPDGFEDASFVWSDKNGYYEISLPERIYNTFYVNDGNYKSTTLEAWSWHMIVDKDQRLDYKIGTDEVYNLNVWLNNGGFDTMFISFRPMVLTDIDNRGQSKSLSIKDKTYNHLDIAPRLDAKDLSITINGEETEIYSLQEYYETGKDDAMNAYLVQVRRTNHSFKKQTIRVEYNKCVEINGKKVMENSMGYFQFYDTCCGK